MKSFCLAAVGHGMHQYDRIIMYDLNRSKIRYQQKLPGGRWGKSRYKQIWWEYPPPKFARVSHSSSVVQLTSAPSCQEQRAVGDVCCRADPHSRSSQASPTPPDDSQISAPSLYSTSDILKHQSCCRLHLETVILGGGGEGEMLGCNSI